MDIVKSDLPFLLQPGRPSRQQVNNSLIGELGYFSWSDFIVYELDWTLSGWHAWRRAYRFVENADYLREIYPSASMINLRARTEKTFPDTREKWIEASKKRAENRKRSRIAELEKRISELEEKVAQLMLNTPS